MSARVPVEWRIAKRRGICHLRPDMPAARPFLVYRDRIGAVSELGFLRRQYLGFSRLRPVWMGRTLLPAADQVGEACLRLGGNGVIGALRRLAFRHLGAVPPLPLGLRADQDRAPDWAPVMHAQFARGGALALPLARALGHSLFVTLHGGDVSKHKNWRPGSLLAQRWPDLVGYAAGFVCVSAAVADLAAAHGVPVAKLIVLPIGVAVPDNPPPRQAKAYLFVGRFVEKKGITVLAEAMRRLRRQGNDTPLVCVGDGPLRPLLETLLREIAGVTLTGWLPPDQVQDQMRQAAALLVPSIIAAGGDAEGLPSVIPEAMAQGVPVIGSDQGGIAEALAQPDSGLLTSPGDAAALALAMDRVVRDAGLAARLSAGGFQTAQRDLNCMVQSAKLESLLLSAIG